VFLITGTVNSHDFYIENLPAGGADFAAALEVCARFNVLTDVLINIPVFCNMTPCALAYDCQRF
jgi:hypothetical protein